LEELAECIRKAVPAHMASTQLKPEAGPVKKTAYS